MSDFILVMVNGKDHTFLIKDNQEVINSMFILLYATKGVPEEENCVRFVVR